MGPIPTIPPVRSAVARLIAFGLIVAACSGSSAEPMDSTTTSQPLSPTSSSTTTSTFQTTTTTEAVSASGINGLAVDDPATVERRVLAVKIDNHAEANPQSGINLADMVIELRVEGITRYIAIFHQSDAEYLGPMRSGRPTDPTLLAAMNEPTFAISGAQDWVQRIIVSRNVHLIGEIGSPATFRISGRRAPHNLYVNTVELRASADARGYPDDAPDGPLWEFGPLSNDAVAATFVRIDFGNTVTWDWDGATGLWYRSGYGRESTYRDQDGTEERIGVPVLVALYVDQYTASPPTGVGGSSVPASVTTGSGKAFVFADGKAIEGTWERESELDWFELKDSDGSTLKVPPGKVWVSLVPDHRGLTFEQ